MNFWFAIKGFKKLYVTSFLHLFYYNSIFVSSSGVRTGFCNALRANNSFVTNMQTVFLDVCMFVIQRVYVKQQCVWLSALFIILLQLHEGLRKCCCSVYLVLLDQHCDILGMMQDQLTQTMRAWHSSVLPATGSELVTLHCPAPAITPSQHCTAHF